MDMIRFIPQYKQRVWGGRRLEEGYGRELPDEAPYGESWEIVDRADEQSVVAAGRFAGKTLHALWTEHRAEIFGEGLPDAERFPLLIKLLDARDDLSIQVHPPARVAAELGGEPKTEMWYLAEVDPGAKLYVGLKRGVTREAFEAALQEGTVAEVVHQLEPQADESIFIESGRLHAIGGGFLIHEIQQNSDTTYRVFDWNRVGLDGQPRQLHVEESLRSIDFDDIEPEIDAAGDGVLAQCEHFRVEKLSVAAGGEVGTACDDRFAIISVIDGWLDGGLSKGDVVLLPRGCAAISVMQDAVVLRTTIPRD